MSVDVPPVDAQFTPSVCVMLTTVIAVLFIAAIANQCAMLVGQAITLVVVTILLAADYMGALDTSNGATTVIQATVDVATTAVVEVGLVDKF